MANSTEKYFCDCFGCDRPINTGENVHSISYTYEKIESNFIVPEFGEALGTWCNDCFVKMKAKGECKLSLDHF